MGASGKHALFPEKWENKVWYSDIGVALTVGAMAYWAMQTSFATVFGLYLAPYLFTNFWLVLYTWLQHTDVDVPHFEGNDWNLVKGAFMTIDRPYGKVYDFLHHRIGSTHVAHHINHTIPHYNAREGYRGDKTKLAGLVFVRSDADRAGDVESWKRVRGDRPKRRRVRVFQRAFAKVGVKKEEKLLLYAHACFNNGINNKYYRLLLIIIKSDSHSILLIKLTRRLTRSPLRNLSRLISSSTAATRMHPRAPS